MGKIQLTQTGAEVQNDLNLVENEVVAFSTTDTYEVGDVVRYGGKMWQCISQVSTAGEWTGATNWSQKTIKQVIDDLSFKTINSESIKGSGDIAIPVIAINPNDLTDGDGEILGLAVGTGDNRVRYKAPSLSHTDGVAFSFGSDSNFTFGDSYSSYNRCGNILTFVVACSITKTNATTTPITLGTFTNIPSALFAKLVPTTVGTDDYLENCDIKAFSDAYSYVEATMAIVKGTNQDIEISVDTTNLVVNTKYHVRYMVSFLLTDNLSSTDPIFSNNSWEVIATTFKSGQAGSYWAVGDTKTDTGTDGYSRTYRISHLGTIYGTKHGVIEQVNVDGTDGSGATGVKWDNNNVNNYQNSTMRSTHLPAVLLRYSSELQAQLEDTSYQVATNGNDGTLLTLTDKIFLPAGKEIGYTSYSRTEENSALITFQYYQTHTTQADHIKYDSSNTARSWWTRSPYSGSSGSVVIVVNNGYENNNYAYSAVRVAPVFAW